MENEEKLKIEILSQILSDGNVFEHGIKEFILILDHRITVHVIQG